MLRTWNHPFQMTLENGNNQWSLILTFLRAPILESQKGPRTWSLTQSIAKHGRHT